MQRTHSLSLRLRQQLTILLSAWFTNCGGQPSLLWTERSSGHAGTGGDPSCYETALPNVVINEVTSNNDGNAVDEYGNADDWVEIVNRGTLPAPLGSLTIDVGSERARLPNGDIAPGSRVLLWADGTPAQGPTHLPFRFKARGFRLTLRRCDRIVSQLDVPALDTNNVYARFPDAQGDPMVCRYASPNRDNGPSCEPPRPPALVESYHFANFDWTLPHPTVPSPLVIEELALRPAAFIELRNVSQAPVDLSTYQLRLAPIRPGVSWPDSSEGVALTLDATRTLGPGERSLVAVSESDVGAISALPQFEGVATLFLADGSVADRVDFARWPSGAALARTESFPGRHVFCIPSTPGAPNENCTILESRDIGDYVRHLRTRSDFDALAAGGGELGMASVKFILDMAAGNQVYLVGWRDWSLHYEFIREVIEHQPHLDRCNSQERSLFDNGWYNFSKSEYFRTDGRRYLLGTLVHHAAADLYTVEFALGDVILPEDMRKAFFAAVEHVLRPEVYFLRPQDSSQTSRALQIEGTLPIVGTNTPFVETKLQPLTAAVGYGVLTYVPSQQLDAQSLGLDVIVVTDDVPNDIPLVGGLVTEAFQTPLSHVNVLCQNRGTPNLALPKAHERQEFASLFGELVRFEVTADGYHLAPASPDEAQAFWDARRPSQTPLVPRLNAERRGLVELRQAGIADLPAIGAKAAQLAELTKVPRSDLRACLVGDGFVVPDPAFAIPMHYFLAHTQSSGARSLLEALIADPEASANRNLRHQRLAEIRGAILNTPVDPELLGDVSQLLRDRFLEMRVRMRSSSNAEDLPGFNGAGLYSSVSADLNDKDYPVEDALREVWASLFSNRGYDERLLINADQLQVAMGVLIHPAFPEERVNGVVISRNMDDVTRGDMYSFNVQLGEASVTNPAPGVTSDQFTYQWPPRTPAVTMKSVSSFNGSKPILSSQEVVSTACAMRAIVDHFRAILDPNWADEYFTMDMEMKLLGDERRLLIKQARPYTFGSWQDPGDCRSF